LVFLLSSWLFVRIQALISASRGKAIWCILVDFGVAIEEEHDCWICFTPELRLMYYF
jgi:hypothetical protein